MDGFLDTDGLTDAQRDMLAMLRTFVDRDVLPVVHDLEQADEFPDAIVAAMAEMGLFSLMIPEQYGGLEESLLTYALVVEELARGWMSLSGIINTHFIVAYLLIRHGTDKQRSRLLPRMATGEVRGAFSMSEPGCGSDVAAITTRAVRDGDDYVVDGRKMWLTNGARAGIVALLTKTGGGEASVYRTMTTFLLEKPPGFGDVGNGLTIPPPIHKLGYRGVETTELLLDGTRLPASSVLGGEDGVGKGFYQMMDGIEVGRVNVAARGCGVGLRALELAIRYAQQRESFGSRIADHQAIQFSLAEMATKVQASHQMMVMAARRKDSGQRGDMEAGMAKYLAAEYCKEVVEASLRIHGGYGYASESEIERLYRDAPLLLIGEGTSEVQKMIIGRRLLERYPLRGDR
jgi:alkylation response protein AidB-like acyl-CoA dehydrogenase